MLLRTCMSFRRSVLKGKLEDERETYPVYEHLSSLVEQTMCNKEDDSYHRLSCVNRECEDCGLKNIKFMLAEEDTSQTAPDVKWERFENVVVGEDKRRLKIVTKITKPGDMFSYFKSLLESFPGHEFRAKWQQEQMHRNIENLPLGEACCVHDYSENYCCRYQEEIQSLYFSQAQVSIHVTILHRHALKHIDGLESTEEQRELITEHLFVISPDIKHDHDSVHECRRYISDYLKEIDYPVKVLHEWTDGCAAQYKSCHCMGDVSYSKLDFGFLTLRNYFETSHAKGPQDGAGSNLKHKADMAVIRRQVVIQNARDLYEYAKENLTEPSSTRYKSQSVGLKRRIFIYVEQHRRNRKNRRFKQIKGSRQIHSIMATDESAGSHLKTRLLSCYCEYCLDGDFGACENSDIVDGWEEIHIETERITRRVTRSQVVGEERNGLKDIVSEGSCVAIASGDPGEDYYLLKVSEGPKELQRLTRDDWGATYPAGAEVLSGHWLLPVTCTRSSRSYKVDYTRMALVYASTARFLCTNLRPLPQDTFEVMEEEHINILQSLEGF